MKRTAVVSVVAVLAILVLWLQREQARGTFDVVERAFVSWLAANTGGHQPLPPLTLVLYDDEASELAGGGSLTNKKAASTVSSVQSRSRQYFSRTTSRNSTARETCGILQRAASSFSNSVDCLDSNFPSPPSPSALSARSCVKATFSTMR